MDPYEHQLLSVFSSYDYDHVGSLDRQGLTQLCQSLQLEEQAPELIGQLLNESHIERASFTQFKEALLRLLDRMQKQAQPPEQHSPDREVSPKLYGSKKYGRRSRPQNDEGSECNANSANVQRSNSQSEVMSKKRKTNYKLKRCTSLPSQNNLVIENGCVLPIDTDGETDVLFTEEMLKEAWKKLGVGENGYLNSNELVLVCDAIGIQKLAESVLKQLSPEFSADRNCRISFQELVEALRQDETWTDVLSGGAATLQQHISEVPPPQLSSSTNHHHHHHRISGNNKNNNINNNDQNTLINSLIMDVTANESLLLHRSPINNKAQQSPASSVCNNTDLFADSQTFQLIQLGPDGNGKIGASLLIDLWENVGITAPKELLHELGFNSEYIKVNDLAQVLDQELKSALELSQNVHNNNSNNNTANCIEAMGGAGDGRITPIVCLSDPHLVLMQATLSLYQCEVRTLRHFLQQLHCERDKLQTDVHDANNRANLLAQEVDDNVLKMERNATNHLHLMEQRHQDLIKELSKQHVGDKEQLAAANAELNDKIVHLESEATKLRNDLQVARKYQLQVEQDNQQLQCKLSELNEQKTAMHQHLASIESERANCVEMEREHIMKPLIEKLAMLEVENAQLRDRNDEMVTEIESLSSTVVSMRSKVQHAATVAGFMDGPLATSTLVHEDDFMGVCMQDTKKSLENHHSLDESMEQCMDDSDQKMIASQLKDITKTKMYDGAATDEDEGHSEGSSEHMTDDLDEMQTKKNQRLRLTSFSDTNDDNEDDEEDDIRGGDPNAPFASNESGFDTADGLNSSAASTATATAAMKSAAHTVTADSCSGNEEIRRLQAKISFLEQILAQNNILIPSAIGCDAMNTLVEQCDLPDELFHTDTKVSKNLVEQLNRHATILENRIQFIHTELAKINNFECNSSAASAERHHANDHSALRAQCSVKENVANLCDTLRSWKKIPNIGTIVKGEQSEMLASVENIERLTSENQKLIAQCSDLENCIELLRAEYERCEDYWHLKLDEERQRFENEQLQTNDTLSDLCAKVAEYEAQYGRGSDQRDTGSAPLATIEETYQLEQQFTDLEREFDDYKQQSENELFRKNEELAMLKEQLCQVMSSDTKCEAAVQADDGRFNRSDATASSSDPIAHKMGLLSMCMVESTNLYGGADDCMSSHSSTNTTSTSNSTPSRPKRMRRHDRAAMYAHHPKVANAQWTSQAQPTGRSNGLMLKSFSVVNGAATAATPTTSTTAIDNNSATAQSHIRPIDGSNQMGANNGDKSETINMPLATVHAMNAHLHALEQTCKQLQQALKQQQLTNEHSLQQWWQSHQNERAQFQAMWRSQNDRLLEMQRIINEKSERLAKCDMLVKELYVENSYLIAQVQRREQQCDYLMQFTANSQGGGGSGGESHATNDILGPF